MTQGSPDGSPVLPPGRIPTPDQALFKRQLDFRSMGSIQRGQSCQRTREDFDAGFDLSRRGVFVWSMADASATRDEDHGGGTDFGHEKGIMIGTADHFLHFHAKFTTNSRHGAHQ